MVGHDDSKVGTMKPIKERKIKVKFNADVAASMAWNFKPLQREITVVPGETALAFYTAKNPTDKPVIGISTYNVLPFEVGQYFNKIQCFCFEEQLLNPHEQVTLQSSNLKVSMHLDVEKTKEDYVYFRSICQYSFILIQSSMKILKWSISMI